MPRLHASAGFGALLAFVLIIAFGAWRYDGFLTEYNLLTVLRYNSMFALVGLGMCFVIMTGGIDLSVGSVAALSSVVAAYLSPYGLAAGLAGGLVAGIAAGTINGFIISKMRILPFIATLATMLAASGVALLLSNQQSVPASYDTNFMAIGQGDFSAYAPEWVSADDAGFFGGVIRIFFGFPIPAWIALFAYLIGSLLLNLTAFGRHVLAVGGGEEASRLMGLPTDRTVFLVYVLSGMLAGMAGVILAAQFGAGQPIEGVGWELFAIASVVVGGTLLTGGKGSVAATLVGTLLLGILFTVLNFENGMGWISLSAYWQSVLRGAFLLVVVILQSRLTKSAAAPA
ncbi:ribose transport system permease protein [Pseudoxanthobacter soli DSM 19599]|uniref:Ribose transport system permease protein n=1 Tax=Pseudoxanthobacter soli DSM 19599 TaxID=1123029 RepID=A0A1M7ZNT7_9HYPH|nr:ABC transporter permease [Pseudoxanthobacter soli]SHO66537.1 ribose transport system permease protein [Pseudoxanthobacter soli DSM 19599]